MSDIGICHNGTVTKKKKDGRVEVSVQRESACGNCTEKSSCGMAESGPLNITVHDPIGLEKGDRVELKIGKGAFYRSVFLVYLAPLAVMIVTAVIADLLFGRDMLSAVLTLASAGVYFYLLKFRAQKETVHITRRIA